MLAFMGLYKILSIGYDISDSFAYYISLSSHEFKVNSKLIDKEFRFAFVFISYD